MQTWQVFLLVSIIFSSINGLFHRAVMMQEEVKPFAHTVVFAFWLDYLL
jgi:hypothetical protein